MAFYTGAVLAGTFDLYSWPANRVANEHPGYWTLGRSISPPTPLRSDTRPAGEVTVSDCLFDFSGRVRGSNFGFWVRKRNKSRSAAVHYRPVDTFPYFLLMADGPAGRMHAGSAAALVHRAAADMWGLNSRAKTRGSRARAVSRAWSYR